MKTKQIFHRLYVAYQSPHFPVQSRAEDAAPYAHTYDNMGTPNMPNILHQGAALGEMGGAGTLFSYGSAWANLCNTPWRMYKHYSHEGGISSPLIAHWPAQIKTGGQWRAQYGHVVDVMATLVDVAGAQYPAERNGVEVLPMEGVSLRPAFAN